MSKIGTARSELSEALARCKSAFWGVGLISALVNLLMLTGPLFMLQVYDRVLPSRSIPTLVGLVVLIIALFALQGVLDAMRARVLQRIGGALDEALSGRVYQAIVRLPLKTRAAATSSGLCAIWIRSGAFLRLAVLRQCSTCHGCHSTLPSATCSIH